MPENCSHFVEWKEHFVSQERGNRVVHYYLKDSTGESVLAVVGTERSVRHMFYAVAEDFVRVYGDENSSYANFKWRSRREVVDWLTSMLSKQNAQGDWSRSPKCDSAQSLGHAKSSVNGNTVQRAQTKDVGRHLPLNISVRNWDIVWSGIAWTCNKQLKHYPAFSRNGIRILAQSFVFVMGKGEHRYVAYLEDMYEDKRGQKKVKVRWFHHTQEVASVIPIRNPYPNEIFITQQVQVISAECVDGPATVLSREHYEECLAFFPNALLVKVHVCFRQFRNNKVKSFDLRKLCGYFSQPILSCLSSTPIIESETMDHGVNGEDENSLGAEHVTSGTKRTHMMLRNSKYDCQMKQKSSYRKRRCNLSSEKLLLLRQMVKQPWYDTLLRPNAKIEVLCEDSGLRGCWFRCTVLEVSGRKIRVQYDDIQEEDGSGKLEEWVPACKLAMLDKFRTRLPNRPTIRPTPIEVQWSSDTVGTAVDAWWSDGWWEGYVTGNSNFRDDHLEVYIPGENLFISVHRHDTRVSRDWVVDQWIDIEPKPDIHSMLSTSVDSEIKASVSSTLLKDHKSDCPLITVAEIPTSDKLSTPEDERLSLASLANSERRLKQETDLINDERLMYYEEKKDNGVEQVSALEGNNEKGFNSSDADGDKEDGDGNYDADNDERGKSEAE